jgi:isoprenylcysteine carboxyl methyltransferase (ICMT) family protein YpbQ
VILASSLPNDDGYVVAAYLVFLALLLVYVVIMAVRLSRVERDLVELTRDE